MFKVRTNKLNKAFVEEQLNVQDTDNYKIVLTDDKCFIENDKINIVFSENNLDEMKNIVKQIIVGEAYYITVENSRGVKKINSRDIEYFEAFDNEVFAIVGKERYYVLEKLYVLESTLVEKNFIRVSKSVLVNILKIEYIKSMMNYKLKLIMQNKDAIEVNRTYTKSFKERIKA